MQPPAAANATRRHAVRLAAPLSPLLIKTPKDGPDATQPTDSSSAMVRIVSSSGCDPSPLQRSSSWPPLSPSLSVGKHVHTQSLPGPETRAIMASRSYSAPVHPCACVRMAPLPAASLQVGAAAVASASCGDTREKTEQPSAVKQHTELWVDCMPLGGQVVTSGGGHIVLLEEYHSARDSPIDSPVALAQPPLQAEPIHLHDHDAHSAMSGMRGRDTSTVPCGSTRERFPPPTVDTGCADNAAFADDSAHSGGASGSRGPMSSLPNEMDTLIPLCHTRCNAVPVVDAGARSPLRRMQLPAAPAAGDDGRCAEMVPFPNTRLESWEHHASGHSVYGQVQAEHRSEHSADVETLTTARSFERKVFRRPPVPATRLSSRCTSTDSGISNGAAHGFANAQVLATQRGCLDHSPLSRGANADAPRRTGSSKSGADDHRRHQQARGRRHSRSGRLNSGDGEGRPLRAVRLSSASSAHSVAAMDAVYGADSLHVLRGGSCAPCPTRVPIATPRALIGDSRGSQPVVQVHADSRPCSRAQWMDRSHTAMR